MKAGVTLRPFFGVCMDVRIISQLLSQASHPSTGDQEALAFFRKVRSILERNGKDFLWLMGGETASKPVERPVFQSFNSVNSENEALRQRIVELERQNAGLIRKAAIGEASVAKKKNEDGSMAFLAWNQAMTTKYGNVHSAKTAFARHFARVSRNPDFRESHIDGWKKANLVPAEGVDALASFKPEKKNSSTKVKPTLENDMRIWSMLFRDHLSEHKIALALNQEFGSVKKARQRMRCRGSVRVAYDRGITDADAVMAAMRPGFLRAVSGSRTQIIKMLQEIVENKVPAETFTMSPRIEDFSSNLA